MNIFNARSWAALIAYCGLSLSANAKNIIEEVVVTASPLGKSVDQVIRPANLLSGEQLRDVASATLGETLANQLGIHSASFGPNVGLPVIRGQSGNRVKLMQDSIGTMDASAASPDHAATVEPLLAKKIEVLRGPASLRYGSGAIGGVVNVIDNRIPDRPRESPSFGLDLSGSSQNVQRKLVFTGDTSLDDISFHIDGLTRSSGNTKIPGYALTDVNQAKSEGFTKGEIDNSDATSTAGSIGGSYFFDSGYLGVSINRILNNYGVPPDSDERVRIDMAQTRYDLKGEWQPDSTLINKVDLRVGKVNYDHVELEDGSPGTAFSNRGTEARIEVLHQPFGKMRGALGVQISKNHFAAIGDEAFIPASDTKQAGIFIMEEVELSSLAVEWGIRVDSQTITSADDNIEHNILNLSILATWPLSDALQFDLGIARAQRAPSAEELLAAGPHPATGSYLIGDSNLDAETSNNIELGLVWSSKFFTATANLFSNSIEDYIFADNRNSQRDELDLYHYTQADAKFQGVEGELNFTLGKTVDIRIFVDSVRASLKKGGDLPRIAPLRYGSQLEYRAATWRGTVTASRSESQTHPGTYETATAGFNRVDMKFDYPLRGEQVLLYAKVRNLLDADIRSASSYLRTVAPEAGREFELGARLLF